MVAGMGIVAAIVCGAGCLMNTGCAKDATFDQRQQTLAGTLDALRQSRFKGEVDLNLGGSPLGVNYGGFASLGPQQSTLHVRGEVDFTNPARPGEGRPADSTAFLPPNMAPIDTTWEQLPLDEREGFLRRLGVSWEKFVATSSSIE